MSKFKHVIFGNVIVNNSIVIGEPEGADGHLRLGKIYIVCWRKPSRIHLFFLRLLFGVRWAEHEEIYALSMEGTDNVAFGCEADRHREIDGKGDSNVD